MKIPQGFKLGKKKSNGIQTGGQNAFVSVAQIFLQCNQKPIPEQCHDTIALIPIDSHANETVDSLSDEKAIKFFLSNGWVIVGVEGSKVTRCPYCKKLYETESISGGSK